MPQEDRRQLFIFLLLMFYFMSSSPPRDAGYPPASDRHKILDQFRQEVQQSREAMAAPYSAGYGNLTGFRLSYQDAVDGRNVSEWPFPDSGKHKFEESQKYSILPDSVGAAAKAVWDTEAEEKVHKGVFHQNISGFARGKFKKNEAVLVPIELPVPHYYDKLKEYRQVLDEINNNNDYSGGGGDTSPFESDGPVIAADPPPSEEEDRPGNVTAKEGETSITMLSDVPPKKLKGLEGTVSSVSLTLSVHDSAEKERHDIELQGVYHPESGNLVAVTRSAKFAGFYALPQLNLASGKQYNTTQQLWLSLLNQTALEDLEFDTVDVLLEKSTQCEYITYLHFESTDLNLSEIHQIDDELLNPLGRPHKKAPQLRVSSGVMYSPDCAIWLDLEPAQGSRKESVLSSFRAATLFFAAILLAEVWLFINQMGATNTPSTLSRLAFWTIAIINMADGVFSMAALLSSMMSRPLYFQLVVCAFLSFTCSSIYEMRYNIMVYSSQANERQISWRTALQGTPIDETENGNGGENGEETTPNVPQPTFPLDEQAIASQLYTRYFFCMMLFLFFGLNIIMAPRFQRRVFEYILLFVFNSYWFPQIYRNVIRGSRKSFTWQFILGISIVRLLPFAYVFSFPNPFHHHRDVKFITFLFFWMFFQIGVLFLQEVLGPRFFLPDKYLPKTYDYHPLLTKGDLENGYNFEDFVSDAPSSSSDRPGSLKCRLDCAICMQSLEIPVIDNSDDSDAHEGSHLVGGATKLLASRNYMVTPCRHIFHTECLEGWMRYKLQCPVCRNSLPPL